MFVCEICLKSDSLCPSCEERLKKGEISELEVEFSKILHRLGDRFKGLREIEIVRVIEPGDLVAVLAKKGHARRLVGKGGRIIKEVTKELGRNIKVLEESGEKGIIEDLLFPARILRINVLYPLGGREKFKVLVAKEDASKVPGSVEAIQAVVKELTGKEMLISFE